MRPFFPSAMLALALAASASADACQWTTSEPEITVGVHGFTLYVESLLACNMWWDPVECGGILYVYEESNGYPGLQRDDYGHDDTCGGLIDGDTVVLG